MDNAKKIEYCIIDDENELIECEKKFYEICVTKGTDDWALKNLQIIDNCRIKPKVPYTDLQVLTLKINNEIVASVKINLNTEKFQLKKMGFKIKNESNICEGINFFAMFDKMINDYKYNKWDIINLLENFVNYFLENTKKMGIKIIYGTCTEKLKNIYLHAGFEIIEIKKINSENKLLIKYELKD